MKSKFSPVVRIRKQTLDKIETKLAKARADVARYTQQIDQMREEVAKFSMPSSGNVSLLNENLQLLRVMREQINELLGKLSIAQREQAHFAHQYKNASLEYEKMKHLENEEVTSRVAAVKRAQEKALDEFATIKFATKGLSK